MRVTTFATAVSFGEELPPDAESAPPAPEQADLFAGESDLLLRKPLNTIEGEGAKA